MKKGLLVVLVIVFIVGIGIVAVNFNRTTGKATLTPGANYGPIESNFNTFSKCIYLSVDDGWDLNIKGSVKAFDKKTGIVVEREDNCDTDTRLVEYHCEDGYLKERAVICPSAMICKEGVCVRN